MNHQVKYKTRTKRVVIPRSARAHFFHRMATLIKLWILDRLYAFFSHRQYGVALHCGHGGRWTALHDDAWLFARVRSKVSYLLTPGLILKSGVWIAALSSIIHLRSRIQYSNLRLCIRANCRLAVSAGYALRPGHGIIPFLQVDVPSP